MTAMARADCMKSLRPALVRTVMLAPLPTVEIALENPGVDGVIGRLRRVTSRSMWSVSHSVPVQARCWWPRSARVASAISTVWT